MSGYVLLHRSLIGHSAFRNEAEAMVFAWLVMRAAWKPCRVRYKGRLISLERGQAAISIRDVAAAMDRDKAWIDRLFRRLKSESMIETVVDAGLTIITISNYTKYQPSRADGGTVGETLAETANETVVRQPRDTEQIREEDKEKKEEEHTSCVQPAQPTAEAVACWNEAAAATGWPTVRRLSDVRRKSLIARLRSEGLDGWQAAIIRARASPYLGQSPPTWFTFDWIVSPNNFIKLIEGNYDRTRSAGRGHRDEGYSPNLAAAAAVFGAVDIGEPDAPRGVAPAGYLGSR